MRKFLVQDPLTEVDDRSPWVRILNHDKCIWYWFPSSSQRDLWPFAYVVTHWERRNIQHFKDYWTQDMSLHWYPKTQSAVTVPYLELETCRDQVINETPCVYWIHRLSWWSFFDPQIYNYNWHILKWQNSHTGPLVCGVWSSIILIFYASTDLNYRDILRT